MIYSMENSTDFKGPDNPRSGPGLCHFHLLRIAKLPWRVSVHSYQHFHHLQPFADNPHDENIL